MNRCSVEDIVDFHKKEFTAVPQTSTSQLALKDRYCYLRKQWNSSNPGMWHLQSITKPERTAAAEITQGTSVKPPRKLMEEETLITNLAEMSHSTCKHTPSKWDTQRLQRQLRIWKKNWRTTSLYQSTVFPKAQGSWTEALWIQRKLHRLWKWWPHVTFMKISH